MGSTVSRSDGPIDVLLGIAQNLVDAGNAEQRRRRLLEGLGRVVPFEAAALLRLEGDVLVPVAAVGLSAAALGKRYRLAEHPRLEQVCRSDAPVVFPSDVALPDPFDGLLAADAGAMHRIHACLGCPLVVNGELLGALTADARDPGAFAGVDLRLLAAAAALAATELRTTQLIEALERAAERQGLIARDLMRDPFAGERSELLGASPLSSRLRREIGLVARSDLTVLIQGETGVGKELVARALYEASGRHQQQMIYVNCAALPEALAESELFGHARGAFTGANADRPGKFEVADGGTLFLDEVGELPLAVQPKLLRALQEGEIQRVGADRPVRVSVRVLAATNRDLGAEVRAGRFRADLYHRLNVYPLSVPPLRERREDVPLLAGHFCDVARRRLGLGPVRLAADAVEALSAYAWPGNVRELENVVSRVALRASVQVPRGDPVILTAREFGPELAPEAPAARPKQEAPSTPAGPLPELLREYERSVIARALEACGGNWAAAARALGMDRGNLYHRGRRLGLTPSRG